MNSLGGCMGILAGLGLFFAVLGVLGLTKVQHVQR